MKFDRYVIQILDPKSERNAFGHAVSLNVLASGSLGGLCGLLAVWDVRGGCYIHMYSLRQDSLAWSLDGCGAYSLPKHHIDAAGTSFLGSGSQKYCTMRLHFSMSTFMVGASFLLWISCGYGCLWCGWGG